MEVPTAGTNKYSPKKIQPEMNLDMLEYVKTN